MNTLFADRLINLQVVGNTVRMEFGVFEMAAPAGSEPPSTKATHVLAMPLDGFVQFFNGQEAVVKKLLSDGVLKRNETTEAA